MIGKSSFKSHLHFSSAPSSIAFMNGTQISNVGAPQCFINKVFFFHRMTGVFASDGFLEDSLFNEQNPNILLKKLQARKTTRRISQLFNRRGSNEDEQEIGEVEVSVFIMLLG